MASGPVAPPARKDGLTIGWPVLAAVALGVVALLAVLVVVMAAGGGGSGGGAPATEVAAQATAAPATLPPAPTTAPPPSTTAVPPTAAPPPPPALPSRNEVLAGLDRSNNVYIRAFFEGDIALLRTAFTGDALAYYEDSMRRMLARFQRQDNQLLQSETLDVQITGADRAVVRTRERWLFRPNGPGAGAPETHTYNEYYELIKIGQTWFVSVNTFQQVP
jgi:hypothetical protein